MDHLYRRIAGEIDWTIADKEADAVPYKAAMHVPIHLDTLVDEIYIAPTSPDWFLDVVQRVCKQFGLPISPKRSDILSSPLR